MLDRVLSYVRSVLAGEVKGDAAVGRYLMDTFGASTEELEKGAFNTSLQVRLHLITRFPMHTNAHPGYANGLLPCQPRPVTSRGFFPSGPHKSLVDVQKAMYFTFHRCILYMFPSWQTLWMNGLESADFPFSTVEDPGVLQVVARSEYFPQRPCHRWTCGGQDVFVYPLIVSVLARRVFQTRA